MCNTDQDSNGTDMEGIMNGRLSHEIEGLKSRSCRATWAFTEYFIVLDPIAILQRLAWRYSRSVVSICLWRLKNWSELKSVLNAKTRIFSFIVLPFSKLPWVSNRITAIYKNHSRSSSFMAQNVGYCQWFTCLPSITGSFYDDRLSPSNDTTGMCFISTAPIKSWIFTWAPVA